MNESRNLENMQNNDTPSNDTPNNDTHWVLAYYLFTTIEDPHAEVRAHKKILEDLDVTCRLYISESGINGQLSGTCEAAQTYIDWMRQHALFHDVRFKIHHHHENVFPRKTVKYRAKLVAIDEAYDINQQGEHVSPKKWKEMLEDGSERILIDVRNDYEWKIGRFEGAELPPCDTFREFSDYADRLREQSDPKQTPVMMYCTGGIRCELYSSILKKKGFDQVYQLDGGVIGYGLEEGNAHWLGKLFVFDDRLAVPISKEESPVISVCHLCKKPNDTYYNCANMDCNHLFLCCSDCAKHLLGCCCHECKDSPRRRPYQPSNHKPFRRQHHYQATQENESVND